MTDKEFLKTKQAYLLYLLKKTQIERNINQKEKSLKSLEGKKEKLEKDLRALKIESDISFHPAPNSSFDNIFFYAGCYMTYGDDQMQIELYHKVGKPIKKTDDLIYCLKTYHTERIVAKYFSLLNPFYLTVDKNLFWPKGSLTERALTFLEEFNGRLESFENEHMIVSNENADNYAFTEEEFSEIEKLFYNYLFTEKEYDASLALKRIPSKYGVSIYKSK